MDVSTRNECKRARQRQRQARYEARQRAGAAVYPVSLIYAGLAPRGGQKQTVRWVGEPILRGSISRPGGRTVHWPRAPASA